MVGRIDRLGKLTRWVEMAGDAIPCRATWSKFDARQAWAAEAEAVLVQDNQQEGTNLRRRSVKPSEVRSWTRLKHTLYVEEESVDTPPPGLPVLTVTCVVLDGARKEFSGRGGCDTTTVVPLETSFSLFFLLWYVASMLGILIEREMW